ncbi:MAG: hypothetical protein ABIC68_08160 [Candidatus Omnitrophota bacterium]
MNIIIGSVGLSKYTGCLSPVYYVLTPRSQEDDPRFFDYVFKIKPFQLSLVRLGNGIMAHRMRIPMELLKCEIVPKPSAEEQKVIVEYLDVVNKIIRRYIREKQKVIKLLNEQKQAIINHAVTRGINPNVRFKPSGVDWIGDIPEHWGTPLLGRLFTRIEQGWSPVAAEGELASDQWAVLTLSAVRRGNFNPLAIKPISMTAEIPLNIQVADGDLLLTRSNTRDRVGDVCIARRVRTKTLLCDLIYRLRIRESEIIPQFLVYQLLSHFGRGQIERDARGSSGTMPKISQGHIKSWRVLLPPKNEQEKIIENIEAESSPVNAVILSHEREVDFLNEFRTRLVADVVTGKIDVRNIKLPEIEDITDSEPIKEQETLEYVEDTEEVVNADE